MYITILEYIYCQHKIKGRYQQSSSRRSLAAIDRGRGRWTTRRWLAFSTTCQWWSIWIDPFLLPSPAENLHHNSPSWHPHCLRHPFSIHCHRDHCHCPLEPRLICLILDGDRRNGLTLSSNRVAISWHAASWFSPGTSGPTGQEWMIHISGVPKKPLLPFKYALPTVFVNVVKKILKWNSPTGVLELRISHTNLVLISVWMQKHTLATMLSIFPW